MKYHLRQLTLAALVAAAPGAAVAADDGWQAQVGQALGKTGSAAPGGVYRVGLPRTDLKATLDGVELKPGFALGGWLAFEKQFHDKAPFSAILFQAGVCGYRSGTSRRLEFQRYASGPV